MQIFIRLIFSILLISSVMATDGAKNSSVTTNADDLSDLIELDDNASTNDSESNDLSDLIEIDDHSGNEIKSTKAKPTEEEDDFGRDSIDDELEADEDSIDPFEPLNRTIFAFNQILQEALLRPVGKVYKFIIPESMRESLDKAFTNVLSPVYFINYVLQGKGAEATTVVARFVINSTLGMLGLFDVAGHFGIKVPTTGLSQTLAVWGIDVGPYLVLPVLGPSTIRDSFGVVGDLVANPLDYYLRRKSSRRKIRYTYQGLRFINTYSDKIDELERIEKESEDIYLAVRSFYLQNLAFKDKEARTVYMADSFSDNDKSSAANDSSESKKDLELDSDDDDWGDDWDD